MISIAIDGPAGAGKSSVSRRAAKQLGYIYVDTGALYRAVGLKFLKQNADPAKQSEVEKILHDTTVEFRFIGGEQHVFLDGEDVNDQIRTPDASMMASAVSAQPPVRAFLLEMQRKIAREQNVIMDGRDIGTVVLPDATVKIFLTASDQVRAVRRFKELEEKGETVTFDEVLQDIRTRDYNDSHRAVAPLKQAEDAVLADTSDCTFEESVQKILSIIEERLGQPL